MTSAYDKRREGFSLHLQSHVNISATIIRCSQGSKCGLLTLNIVVRCFCGPATDFVPTICSTLPIPNHSSTYCEHHQMQPCGSMLLQGKCSPSRLQDPDPVFIFFAIYHRLHTYVWTYSSLPPSSAADCSHSSGQCSWWGSAAKSQAAEPAAELSRLQPAARSRPGAQLTLSLGGERPPSQHHH